MDTSLQKRRLARMIVMSVAAFLVATGSFVGYVAGDIAILGPVFVAAIAAGVAAQIWFIVGVARDGQAPTGKA